MKKTILVILLLIFMKQNTHAQEFYFGAKLTSHMINANIENKNETDYYLPISGIKAIGEFSLMDDLGVAVQPGWSFPTDEFSGLEVDILVKKYIMSKKIFIEIGTNIHFNKQKHHGTDPVSFISDDNLLLYNFGLGYFITETTFFELNYLKPNKTVIGYDVFANGTKFNKEINSVLSFSVGVLFH